MASAPTLVVATELGGLASAPRLDTEGEMGLAGLVGPSMGHIAAPLPVVAASRPDTLGLGKPVLGVGRVLLGGRLFLQPLGTRPSP